MDTAAEGEGGMNWESRIVIQTLRCVKQMDTGKLLESTGSSAQCSVMTEGRDGGWAQGRSKREGTHVYIKPIHFIVQQKLTQHCKAIILQLKKKSHSLSYNYPDLCPLIALENHCLHIPFLRVSYCGHSCRQKHILYGIFFT